MKQHHLSPEAKRRRDQVRKANEMTPDKYLSDQEYTRFFKNLTKMELENPRDTLLLELLAYTGARPSEMLALRVKDVDPGGLIFLNGLKGSNSRRIPLHPRLFNKLAIFVIGLKPSELVFPICYSRLHQIGQDYLPRGKSIKALRHTFALKLYKKTKDIRLVQKMLGHRFVSTTEIYTDYAFADEELKEKVLSAWS